MGVAYGLTCVECGESYQLGKPHRLHTKLHVKETFGFSTIGSCDEPTIQHSHFLLGLQHFLMRHRQHELRVLGDNLTINDGITWFAHNDCSEQSLNQLLLQEVGVPNAKAEREGVDSDLLERLNQGGKKAELNFPPNEFDS